MYWKGMHTTIQLITRSCKTCQTSKRRKLNYRHVLPKTVISTPWECLCVDLIGLNTLKGRDDLQIDFMALTTINPASSWFEMVELPLDTWLQRKTVNGKELLTANKIFNKTSDCIARLVNKTWLCRYPWCGYFIYNNGSEFKLHFEYICKSYGIKHKPTTVKNLQANAIWNVWIKLLDRCYAQVKLIWLNQLPLMTSMPFLTRWHGKFDLPIIQACFLFFT